MNAFDKMWMISNQEIELELCKRYESFVPGNPDFDALSKQIAKNRADREHYEKCMSEPISI